MVPALDFDMYNYLCLVLLEGRGVPEIGDVPFDTLVEINQNELQQNSELIASSLANPHTLDVPVRRRLFLYDAYRTNERIEHILEQALPDEDLPPHTAFSKYSDLALKYQRLSDLIEDTMVTPQDREPKDYATMVVDLRTLVLSLTKVFVTRLHAGLLKDGRYTSYGKAAAKAMAAPLFELGDEQRDGISTRSGSQLQRLLTARKQKIFGGIAEGEVENYLDDGLDLVIRVNRFLALVFQNVNKESSPILATAYKIEQMKQASDHYKYSWLTKHGCR